MSADPDRLDKLVASVLEGLPVDWPGAESNATDQDEHSSVAALQDVSRIVQFDRKLQRAGPPRKSPAPHEESDPDPAS